MTATPLLVDDHARVRTLTLNRPEALNACNEALYDALTEGLLAEMVKDGFINYYFDRHEIELRDKLILYALASQGKRDFDAINIESTSSTANAQLNLKTKETEVHDVKKIELSGRQKVALIPTKNEFTLLKNRDMRFGGRLFAVVGTAPIMEAILVTRVGEQEWTSESLFETELPCLLNSARPPVFTF